MYCKKCGKEVNDDAFVCIHCGCLLDESYLNSNGGKTTKGTIGSNSSPSVSTGENKTFLGIFSGLFLAAIGLIIAFLYPTRSTERETFMTGWGIGFFCEFIITLILMLEFY